MEPIKPIPPETLRLAAAGLQREVEKLARLERAAARAVLVEAENRGGRP